MTAYENVSGTYWNNSGAWNPNGIPVSGDTVGIHVGTMTISGYSAACRSANVSTNLVVRGTGGLALDDHADAQITGNGHLVLIGVQTSPIIVGPSSAPTNPWTFSISNVSSVYGLIRYAKTIPKTTVHLTDSELGFYPQSNPEEQIITGSWSMTRSRLYSYGAKYYIKPTGNMSFYESFLDHCLPSIYSNNHYIIAYDMPQYAGRSRGRHIAISIPLGGEGEYSVDTAYGSRKVTFDGTLLWDNASSYNHPLGQRLFVAQMNTLKDDANEYVKVTWSGGHYAAAELTTFNPDTGAGRDAKTGHWKYRLVFAERPYQSMT